MATPKTQSFGGIDLSVDGDSYELALADTTASVRIFPPASSSFGTYPALVVVELASTDSPYAVLMENGRPVYVRNDEKSVLVKTEGAQRIRLRVIAKGSGGAGSANFYLLEQAGFTYTTSI